MSTEGNAIVTPDASGGAASGASGGSFQTLGFPTVALAAVIVGAGIYIASQYDTKAGWLLAFIILLAIAFRYPSFGDEITKLLSAPVSNQQTSSDVSTEGNAIVPVTDQIDVPTINFSNN